MTKGELIKALDDFKWDAEVVLKLSNNERVSIGAVSSVLGWGWGKAAIEVTEDVYSQAQVDDMLERVERGGDE